ncbi:MAG TPA: metalloregulator ArsR/SmtB family transcription factor [Candidatus Acidoferrales bacterium]|jgi:predicted ArsR family transcriptional regulator|nr:metalloregulator ArsR/SmtB family transcription factor [Candidatus Acidoferrales bacterium]
MPLSPGTGDRKTRRAIVHLLKTDGPLTSAQLAGRLGLTAMAVRQHLYTLQSEKFVAVEERPVPIGRPAKHWRLTREADRLFPDAYAELSVSLIGALGDAFGPEGLQRVLESRGARQQALYTARIPPTASLKEKVRQLARIRTEEGYMAEVHAAGKRAFLLTENHCPICAAATQCQGFCTAELDLFRKVLGPGVQIDREEHIVSGARRCAYRIVG